MKIKDYKRLSASIVVFVLLFVLWEVAVKYFGLFEYILPPPSDVALYLWQAITDGSLISAIWVTLKRLLMGYSIGLLVGIPTGMLCSRFNCFKDTIGLLALGLQALPSVCWVPLAIMWFGQEESAMLFVVVMGTVWSMILATEHGVKKYSTNLFASSTDNGLKGYAHLVESYLASVIPKYLGWNETRLGICMAFTYGSRNLRYNSFGLWAWAVAPLRT